MFGGMQNMMKGMSIAANNMASSMGAALVLQEGAIVHLRCQSTGKNVRIHPGDARVDGLGGAGNPAKFTVRRHGIDVVAFQNVASPARYLGVNPQGQLKGDGHGGPWCHFKIVNKGNNQYCFNSVAHGGHMGIMPSGQPKNSQNTGRGPHGTFTVQLIGGPGPTAAPGGSVTVTPTISSAPAVHCRVPCRGGHIMSYCASSRHSVRCDVCKKNCGGRPSFGCRRCNWDVCGECNNRGGAPAAVSVTVSAPVARNHPCYRRHPIHYSASSRSSIRCDVCKRNCRGEPSFGCRRCNIDICGRCNSGATAMLTQGAVVLLKCQSTSKNLRIMGNGIVDGNGGAGKWAKFTVHRHEQGPAGVVSFQNVGNPSHYLGVNPQGELKGDGHGGKWCHFRLVKKGPTSFCFHSFTHNRGHVGILPNGAPKNAFQTGTGPHGTFTVQRLNAPAPAAAPISVSVAPTMPVGSGAPSVTVMPSPAGSGPAPSVVVSPSGSGPAPAVSVTVGGSSAPTVTVSGFGAPTPVVSGSGSASMTVYATPTQPMSMGQGVKCNKAGCKHFMEHHPVGLGQMHDLTCNKVGCENFIEHGCPQHSFRMN